ncbi:MAG TPA: polysaccharide deacetylase family protein [Ktedonobacterales bacterium]|jgi:peptidoglycan/xylan/chitin deacetylase (PgdA/CDA1 family)|nr:polysaccharide deacetylase family protein [Ktedonobacterales bacterium]
MNLVSYSIKTKGVLAFSRRLVTVFTRFGVSEERTRRSLDSMIEAVRAYDSAPTFFIPASVLGRSSGLIRRVQRSGAEIGVHGYVHNDYRGLSKDAQARQTRDAIAVFDREKIQFAGFRNPYLGWDEVSIEVFRSCGFSYDSNEAVFHDVVAVNGLASALADSLSRSLKLFQAIPYTEYNLRPHTEDGLVRIPLSIPDDEMLFDRLQITDTDRLGELWRSIMRRVYDAGGIYVLNLHPERGVLARGALDALLRKAREFALPVWVARLCEVQEWWRERAETTAQVTSAGDGHWRVEVIGSPRATLLTRNLTIEGSETTPWPGGDCRVMSRSCVVAAAAFPGVALSERTTPDVERMLREQGYPILRVASEAQAAGSVFVDRPEGLGGDRAERQHTASALVKVIEQGAAPLARIGIWPEGRRAALSITGDIDSVTIQDFFLRILEVRRFSAA